MNLEKQNLLTGRLTRKEYITGHILLLAGLMIVFGITDFIGSFEIFVITMFVCIPFALYIDFSITVRRLHDVNLSAWWSILLPFATLILMFAPTHTNDNKYGPAVFNRKLSVKRILINQ